MVRKALAALLVELTAAKDLVDVNVAAGKALETLSGPASGQDGSEATKAI